MAKPRATKPTSRQAVIDWMKDVEIPRGAPFHPGTEDVSPWFHGRYTMSNAYNRTFLNYLHQFRLFSHIRHIISVKIPDQIF